MLATFGEDLQGKGIGTTIGSTLKEIAFGVWGFHKFWWLVDATNHPSKKVAQKIGLSFAHSWEDEVKHSEQSSGLWFAYVQSRPEGLPDGILQGESVAYWQETRTSSLLQAVIQSRKN